MKMKFVKTGINGEGIGYADRMPVFCEGVLAGETAEVEITQRNKTYAKAQLIRIIERSENRRKPFCRYYEECGACSLMHVRNMTQAQIKTDLLAEALYKYGNVKRHFVRRFHESPLTSGYRNQCKLPVAEKDGKLVTGMYKPGSNHFTEIPSCLIHDPQLEEARKAVLDVLNKYHMRAYDKKAQYGIRYLILRHLNNQTQCTLITGKDRIDQACINDLMKIRYMTSVFQSVNTELKGTAFFGSRCTLLAGKETIEVKTGDITLYLSPESFFQLNFPQAEKLYETAVSKVDPCGLLVEAYCGIGAMSLMAAKKAQRVIGIEYVKDAVENAKRNAEANGITNAEFFAADAADGLYRAARMDKVDILLADPPRSGMDDNMLEAILRVQPEKIIYVSCNPATLAKNIKVLKEKYLVETVMPFDLFPNTPHIESITVLQKAKA